MRGKCLNERVDNVGLSSDLGSLPTPRTSGRIVDAHLDLSYNALNGRDVIRPAVEQPANEDGIATVGLPDLRGGDVGLVCATIFCSPATETQPGYRSADEAYATAQRHLDWYRSQADVGHFQFATRAGDLAVKERSHGQRAILLLEGADAIRSADDVGNFVEAGVRIVGLAWKRTLYAGGTGAPGPLSDEGRAMVRILDRFAIIHDLSHLAEESFWELLDLSDGPVMASHSNCRSIVPTDRQLSDEMIRAVIGRGGVIGINFFDKFLLPPEEYGSRRATLTDVVLHVRHICQLAGNSNHVGLGTDMDGGLGREQIPVEIRTSADLPRVGDALIAAGFDDAAIAAILGANWIRFFEANLPET